MLRSEKLALEIKDAEAQMNGSEGDTSGAEVTSPEVTAHVEGQGNVADAEDITEAPQRKEPVQADLPNLSETSLKTNWETRFKSYKGSTDTTIFELRADLAKEREISLLLQKKVSEVQGTIDNLQDSIINKERSSVLMSKDVTSVIGDDVAKSIGDVINSSIADKVNPLKQELEARKIKDLESAKLQTEAAQADNEKHFASTYREFVTHNGFDFDAINNDPNFINVYLKQPDKVSNEIRTSILKRALGNYDATTVAKLFVGYGREAQANINSNLEPLGNGQSTVTSEIKPKLAEVEDTISTKEIDHFYTEGYKTMSQSEQAIYQKRIDVCWSKGTVTGDTR